MREQFIWGLLSLVSQCISVRKECMYVYDVNSDVTRTYKIPKRDKCQMSKDHAISTGL